MSIFKKLVSYENAKQIAESAFVESELSTRLFPIKDCKNLICAKTIKATEDVPCFSRSTVDGYAILASDSCGASDSLPSILDLIGNVNIGKSCDYQLKSGQAVYVPTGGMVPNFADAVMMREYTKCLVDSQLAIYKPVAKGDNIIEKGEDFKVGEVLINKGTVLDARHITLPSSLGISSLCCYEPTKFAIISTGDELIDITEPKSNICEIRDTNMISLEAQISKYNDLTVYTNRVKDDFSLIVNAISEALKLADVVLMSGGSSIGEHDYTEKALKHLGADILVSGISMKPGMPTIIARIGNKLIFGLPGHPLACLMTAEMFVFKPLKLAKGVNVKNSITKAKASKSIHSSAGRTFLLPVSICGEGDEKTFNPLFSKSGLLSVVAKADGFIIIGEDEEGIAKGEIREVILL